MSLSTDPPRRYELDILRDDVERRAPAWKVDLLDERVKRLENGTFKRDIALMTMGWVIVMLVIIAANLFAALFDLVR